MPHPLNVVYTDQVSFHLMFMLAGLQVWLFLLPQAAVFSDVSPFGNIVTASTSYCPQQIILNHNETT